MSGYKSLDELEVVLRSGAGVAIICEGEDHREDEFFYREWFGSLGRSVTFHAQDGWKYVQAAVAALRRSGIPVPVYGLLDRDLTPNEEIARQSDPSFDDFRDREDDLDELQQHVSGKLVFQELHRTIPCARKRPDRMDLAERYLDQCPEAPPDVDALIRVILDRAGRDRQL